MIFDNQLAREIQAKSAQDLGAESLKKKLSKKGLHFFFSDFFFNSLEFSETHFDLVASKIGAKLNFLNYCRKLLSKNLFSPSSFFVKRKNVKNCF